MRVFEDVSFENSEPFQTVYLQTELVKAKEEDGKWIVFLEASNESLDQDGEVTVMKALQDASKDYLNYGVISWDHQHRTKNDPESIIGEPLDIAFSSNKSTLIKGMLYQKNKKAQSVWNNIQSGSSRFGASIGGYILKKSNNVINKVHWRDTAITDKPVNNSTLGRVSLLPFSEFAKALMAGGGVNAANFTGGRALAGESLQGATVNYINMNKDLLNTILKNFLYQIQAGRIHTQMDIKKFVDNFCLKETVTDQIAQFLIDKIATLNVQ